MKDKRCFDHSDEEGRYLEHAWLESSVLFEIGLGIPHIHENASRMLRECFENASRMLRECFENASRIEPDFEAHLARLRLHLPLSGVP